MGEKKTPQMIEIFFYHCSHNLEGFAFLNPINQLHLKLLFVVSTPWISNKTFSGNKVDLQNEPVDAVAQCNVTNMLVSV